MEALRALSPTMRRTALQAMPRAALQKLAKEAGLRVRDLGRLPARITRLRMTGRSRADAARPGKRKVCGYRGQPFG